MRRALIFAVMAAIANSQTFEVASVKPSSANGPPNSNFPLGPGDVYVQNGGFFSATNYPFTAYLFFAYKLHGNQAESLAPQLPNWATTERFDIQARAQGNPTKDEMRLMMRALLAERFKLAIHNESREAPVLAFVLAKPGKLGPDLQAHPKDAPCSTTPDPSASTPNPSAKLPVLCNGLYPMPPRSAGQLRFAGRNVTLTFIADTLSARTNTGRQLIDATGLTGTFDFSLEFMLDANAHPDAPGVSFEEALRDQLGIKLQAQKGQISVMKIDHVERPTAN